MIRGVKPEDKLRLQSKSKRIGKCLVWTGQKTKKGYGKIQIGSRKNGTRRTVATHVLSYEIYKGSRRGLHVLHTCDNTSCIDPRHLYLGDNDQNVSDRKKRGRFVGMKGVKNPLAKLNDSIVLKIIRDVKVASCSVVADKYKVHISSVYHIKAGHTWLHLPRN